MVANIWIQIISDYLNSKIEESNLEIYGLKKSKGN